MKHAPRNINKKDYVQVVTILDIVIIGFAIGVVALLFFIFMRHTEGIAKVEISTDHERFIYSLDEDRALVLSGPLGETFVDIKDGYVDILDSPGRRKICVNAKPISSNGEWLACLPNKVFIRIIGGAVIPEDENAVDVIVF